MTEPAPSPTPRELNFLVHHEGDDVAVAVRDVDPGDSECAYLATGSRFVINVLNPIPLGHKVALRDLAESEHVTEYGVPVGVTRCAIATGDLVHTHNLRSARWQHSV